MNLIKNYDCNLEAPGLANVAAAIATGADVVQGQNFEEIQLDPKNKNRTPVTNKDSVGSKRQRPLYNHPIYANYTFSVG